MKHIILVLFFFTAAWPLQAQQLIHDPHAEPRELGDFHSVQVSGLVELYLSQGERPGVAVSARSPEARESIQTQVHNGELSISGGGLARGGKTRVYVGVQTLDQLTVSGTSNVIVVGEISARELRIDLSGASDFDGTVHAGALRLSLSGASDADIRGRAGDLNLKVTGASHLRGYGLACDNCLVNGSGASEIKLTVNQVVNAELSGATNIRYKGEGKKGNIRTTGASSVAKTD